LTLFDAPAAAKAVSANVAAAQPVSAAGVKRSRITGVQAAAISAIATNLSAHTVLNLFDGLNVEVEWLRQEQITVGNDFWSGRLTDDPLSAVDLSVVNGISHIQVNSPKYGLFDLEPQADGSFAVRELDAELIKGNGQCVVEVTNDPAATTLDLKSLAAVSGAGGLTSMAVYTPVTVDVLVVYTPAVCAKLGSHAACKAKAQAGVNSENSTFGRSGIVHRMRLVNARDINHVSSGNLATELSWVAGSAEVAALRNEVGADLVAYMSETDIHGMAGIAQGAGPFSSCYYSTFSGVWPHEVGHNQGAGHDKANGGGKYPYSHGHYWNNGTKVVGTIMSYTGSRISYFSNPEISYQGFPTGVTNDQDNARTINEFDTTVAGWKPSKLLMDAAVGITVSTPIPPERSAFNILVAATNAGPEVATNITVTVPLPGTLSYVNDTGGGAYNSATGVWQVPSLAAGSNVLLTISAKPNSGTRGTSIAIAAVVASVGTSFVDFDFYNNSNSVSIVPQADLSTTYAWTNNLSGLWSAAINWTNSTPPQAGGTNTGVLKFFGAASYTASNDFAGIFQINFLDFSNSSTNQSGIAGNPIQFVAYSASAKPQCYVHAGGPAVVSNQLILSESLNLFSPSGKPLWLAGGISGPGDILKNDINRLLLSASNSFSGSLQVNGGSVEISNLQALSQCYYVNVADGAWLALQGGGSYPPTALQIQGDGGGSGSLAFNYAGNGVCSWPGNITLLDNATIGSTGVWVTNTFSGAITGNGDLTLLAQGSSSNHLGVFVLGNPANSWSGDTYVKAGAAASCQLKLAASNGLPVATRVILDSAGDAFHFGQFDLNGFSQTLAGLQGDSTTNSIFNSSAIAAVLTVNQSQDDDWAFAMSGPLSLTRTGGGTVTWSGIASHTGGTALRDGFTIVNGRVAPGQVSVGPGWIGGGGFVQNLVVTNKGVLSPGLSGVAATLAISNLTCTSGARLVFNITNRLTMGGGTNDFITVSNVAIAGATTVSLNLLATPAVGRYVFLRSAGAISGTNNVALAPEVLNTRFQATLDVSVSNEIAVVIGAAVSPQNLVWRGDGLTNQWDIGVTTNWVAGAAPQVFYNADAVTFDDSGSHAPSLALVGALSPGSITINSTNAFTLAGSGSLIGPADITKQGGADFTLSTANNFSSGTVFLEAGQIWLANANAISGMSAVTVADGAELTMSKNSTYANVPVTITGNGDTIGHGAMYFRTAGTVTWPGEIDLNGPSQISVYSSGSTVNLNGPITDAAEATSDLTLMASGASSTHDQYFALKAPCTYGGNTTFDTYYASCHVKLGLNNALPVSTVLTLAGGITKSVPEIAELQLNGFSQELAGLTTAAGATGSGGVNQIINITANAGALTINNFDDFVFAGSLGGAGTYNNFSLTKLGTGTFILAGSNSFTGPLSVGGGTLVVSNLVATPAGCLLTLSNVPDAVFKLENAVQLGALIGGGALGGNVNLGANSLTVGDAQDATFAGTLYGTGGVTKIGTNTTWTLTGANTFTGPLAVNAGTLVVSSAQNGTRTISVSDGAALRVVVSGTSQLSPTNLTLGTSAGATLIYSNVTSTTVAPISAGKVSFAGTLTLNINSGTFVVGNSYPLITWTGTGLSNTIGITLNVTGLPSSGFGGLAIVGNTLYLQIIYARQPLSWTGGNGNWDVGNSGNTIWKDFAGATTYYQESPSADAVLFDSTFGSGGIVTLNTNIAPASVTVSNSATSYTFSGSGAIVGNTGLTKSGAGTLIVTTTNTYTGFTAITDGTLQLGDGSTKNGVVSGNITNNAALVFANPSAQTHIGIISGSGTLNKSVAGTLTLTATNTFTGNTTISAGQLVIGDAGQLGGGSYAGNIANNAALVYSSSAAQTLGGAISGTGSLTKNGVSTLTLVGRNSYSGGTILAAGTLNITNDAALGATSGGLTFSGSSTLRAGVNVALSSTRNLTLNTGVTGTLDPQTNQLTVSGNITGAGTLNKPAGTGTLVLAGDNSSWTGPLTLGATGWLQLASSTALGASGTAKTIGLTSAATDTSGIQLINNVTIANKNLTLKGRAVGNYFLQNVSGTNVWAGTINMNATGGSYYISSLAGLLELSGVITNTVNNANARNVIFEGAGATLVSGAIKDGAGATYRSQVTMNGSGVLTLTGTNTYSGLTTVNNGTLAVGCDLTLKAGNALTLSGGTFDAGSFSNSLVTLTLSTGSTNILAVNTGTCKLSFSGLSGAGTLTITGTLGPTTLRFGTSSTALTPEQLAQIKTAIGWKIGLDANGYVLAIPPGTQINLY
jgi:autotransporter-associated beta strand protein